MPDRKLRVFLCHASQDKPIVRELYQRLLAEGWIDSWLDEEKLLPGQDWDVEIEKVVERADAVIVCLSNSSITKEGYIQKEIRKVLDASDQKPDGTIFIIPLRLENCEVPRRLNKWQWLDYFPENRKFYSTERLLGALHSRAESLKIPAWNLTDGGIRIYIFSKMEFLKVPSGSFVMGSNLYSFERPEHNNIIPYDYWMGRFPVTNEDYAVSESSMGFSFNYSRAKERYPVTGISLIDALAYVQWLNRTYKKELPKGYEYCIPTESEWEKAARGQGGRMYPWGNDMNVNLCNTIESETSGTTPVGAFSPEGDSPYGIADLAGNVSEWTCSILKNYPYDLALDRRRIVYSSLHETFVLRGGSYSQPLDYARTTFRDIGFAFLKSSVSGLRLAICPQKRKI